MSEIDRALELHRAGRLEEAEALYRRVLQLQPEQPDALHLLGVLAFQGGRHDEAVARIRQALALRPRWAEAHNNLGLALQGQGRLEQAVTAYQQALQLNPALSDARVNLGVIFLEEGKTAEALAAFTDAVRLTPDSADAHYNLGNALSGLGRWSEAIAAYQRAIDLAPEYTEAHNNLGLVFHARKRYEDAQAALERSLAIAPNDPQVHNNLGTVLAKQAKFVEAIAHCRAALTLKPDYADAYNNLGLALQGAGQIAEALAAFRQAIALRNDFAEAHSNLGSALLMQGQRDDAIASFRRALVLEPLPGTHSILFQAMHYTPGLDADAIFAEAREWNRRYAKPLTARIPAHHNDCSRARRLRVGYVSADFHSHPVGYFVSPVFANHDKARFEVFAYADVLHRDDLTERFIGYADRWCEVKELDDEALAERIHADGIDILIDLAGHTMHNRLLVFARKPAPIQVTGGGNNDTTGLDVMDYFISDRFHTPPGAERYFTETLIRMPNDYICYGPPEYAPEVSAPPVLERGYITFGCFNNLAKVNSAVIALWAQILAALPEARLNLQTRDLRDPVTCERVRERFAAQGITLARLDLDGQVFHQTLLANYADIDIALDPFPYSGGLTTCEALWMGVPVVTLTGQTFTSRHSTSHLCNVGLPELVTSTPEAYVATVLDLAQDPERLTALRRTLRVKMAASPVCNAERYTRDLEAAYRGMWQKWCDRQRTLVATTDIPASSEGPMPFSVRIHPQVSLCLPDSVQSLTTYVLLEQEDWFEDEIAFVRRLLQPGMHAIDIGASYGVYSTTMARIVGPGGKVWAFEPARSPAAYLRKSIERNRLTNIVLSHLALSNRTGAAKLNLNPQSELNSLADEGTSHGDQETVELSTLDQCLRTYGWQSIDFVKMDAEGEEGRIVEGGQQFFAAHSPLVLFELKHGDELNWSLLRQFTGIGYRLYRLVPGLEMLAPFDAEGGANPWQLNLFACKPDRARLLEQQGLLAREQGTDMQASFQAEYLWPDLLRRWPYASKRLQSWTTTDQSKRPQDHHRYRQALDCYAQARAQDLPASTRFAALRQCFIMLQQAIPPEAGCCRLQSLARVAWEFGERRVALSALQKLIDQLSMAPVTFDEPFLVVCRRFESIDPAEELQQWCLAAALEQREKLQAFSSYFSGNGSLPSLELAQTLPFYGAEMERRRQLIRMRHGVQTGPETHALLARESEDNLNPQFWTRSP